MLYTNRSRAGKQRSWLALLAIGVWLTPTLGAGAAQSNAVATAVRSSDRVLNRLVMEGYVGSPTFKRLADAIAATQTLVYVEAGVCAFGHAKACLLPFVAATDQGRYLRIVLTRPLNLANRHRTVALIGHELQHALEVAERPDVVDVQSMLEMYRRIGVPINGQAAYETSEARSAGDAVLDELRVSEASRRRRARTP
jgi:hypothetical protein